MPTPREILERLKSVPYPGYSRDIVSFGIVKDIEVGGRSVTFTLVPTTHDAAVIGEIRHGIEQVARSMGIAAVEFAIEEPPREPLSGLKPKVAKIDGIRRVIAVASGKGGVGKSTVATNLALALHAAGREVGLLDADVYGPSVPTMLGLHERPRADAQKRIEPVFRHGLKAISMGLFIETGKPIIWRGPMVTKLLVEFVRNVLWGELDYLVLDLPPGTGDAQLTICQQVPLDGGVIVTTPQEVALLDVKRGVTMFREVGVPVLGVVDNMSGYACRKCGREFDLFGRGGSQVMAAELDIPVLGSIPLVREIRECADRGLPIVAANPSHPQSQAFLKIAERVEQELAEVGTPKPPAHALAAR